MSTSPLVKIAGSWAAPLVIILAYVGLILTMQPPMTIALFVLLGLLCVLVLWFVFRELTAHAAINRAISVGDADDVISRARSAADHRFTRRGRIPFLVYEAIGLGLRGQWQDSLEGAAAADVRAPAMTRMLAASARIAAATELGDAAAARAALAEVTVLARRLGWRADVIVRESQARVLFAEGDRPGALPIFRGLAADIRVGAAARAAALLYAGRCEDDREVARKDFAAAGKLAPRTWIKPAADAELAGR